MIVAIIPARGGSKRIPRKNIRNFCGQPILKYSIDAARDSGVFDRIIVSTDDEEIANVAIASGAEVPFIRPPELSCDHATTVEAVSHAIHWIIDHECPVQYACCIYATAPLVQSGDLAAALPVLQSGRWDYVISATSFVFPIFRALQYKDDGAVKMIFPQYVHTRSQDLPTAWHDAGQFYWGQGTAWLNKVPIFGPTSTICPIPRWRVQDIDSIEDWEQVELLYKMSFKTERFA